MRDTQCLTVADPGFPRGSAPIPEGAPTYYLTNFSRKLHETKEILAQRGARIPCIPLDSPLLVNINVP